MGEKIQRTWPAHDIWDGIKQQWSIAKNCNQHPFHPQRELHISTLFVSTWKWLKHSNLTLIVVLTHTIGNGNGVGMFWNQFVATVIRCNYKTSKNKCGSILCKCRKNGLKCTLTCKTVVEWLVQTWQRKETLNRRMTLKIMETFSKNYSNFDVSIFKDNFQNNLKRAFNFVNYIKAFLNIRII